MANSSPEKLLENLFNSFDTTSNGYLRKEDLRKLCKGISLTDEEFETIFKELDQDGDEKISRDDFVQGFAESHQLFLQTPPASPVAIQTYSDFKPIPEENEQDILEEEEKLKSSNERLSRNKERNLQQTKTLNSSLSKENSSTSSKGAPVPIVHSDSVFSQSSFGNGSISGENSNNRRLSWKQFTEDIGLDYYLMSQEGQEEVCDMYQQLSDPTTQHLLENFENVVISLVKEVKKHECENERLEKSFKRDKVEHSKHLKRLEEEMDAQVQRVEGRIRKEEQERYEKEKQELKNEFESEIFQLQDNLKKLQKLEVPVQGDDDVMKAQLQELCQENRQLKRSLTDVQTTLALQRSEMVTLRQTYEEKKRELDIEKKTQMDIIKEQESLSKQVLMLQEANKNLLDANDDIRATIEHTPPPTLSALLRSSSLSLAIQEKLSSVENRSDYVREYLSSTPAQSYEKPIAKMNSCLAEELSKSTSPRTRRVLPAQDSVEVEDIPEDFDSGHSTLQGIAEMEIEVDRQSNVSRHSNRSAGRDNTCHHQPRKKTRIYRLQSLQNAAPENSMLTEEESVSSLNSPVNSYNLQRAHSVTHNANSSVQNQQHFHRSHQQPQNSSQPTAQHKIQRLSKRASHSHNADHTGYNYSHPYNQQQTNSECVHHTYDDLEMEHVDEEMDHNISMKSPISPVLLDEDLDRIRPNLSRANSTCSQCSEHSRYSADRRQQAIAKKYNILLEPPVSATPERMYKVVLCGDAAVGKSSFIMRLCKNKFVNNLNSTLGVDFQTKTLMVDGRCVALQLWDTAGQERFRSIAKSYFRRADGVLLLYDCSYERSFLSVRDWVQTVEEGAQKKIPIMLAANKTDLRDRSNPQSGVVDGFVTTEEGHRLAREFDAVFIETSAKNGSNVAEAALEFSRLLKSNEDLEVKSVGLQLHEMKIENTKTSCC